MFSSLHGSLSPKARTWEQLNFDELNKGTAHGVALRKLLRVGLGADLQGSVHHSVGLHLGDRGRLAGQCLCRGGRPARMPALPRKGNPARFSSPRNCRCRVSLVDKNGVLYAATNPDGKVYKIEPRVEVREGKNPEVGPAAPWKSSLFRSGDEVYLGPRPR